VRVSQEWSWRSCPSWQATPPAGSQSVSNTQRCQHQSSRCWTLITPCSPRIQCVSTYSLYREWPPEARPPPYNADRHDRSPPEVDFPLHEDARTARQVKCNLVIRACLPWPHTKNWVIWGSFSMEWEGDERNEQVLAWSCNPVSMRRKPRSASHIQSRNGVHTGIVRILYVCSI